MGQTEIKYDLKQEFNSHKFRKYLIKKNKGSAKSSTSGNFAHNRLLEQINKVLGNLVRNYNINQTYVDGDDRWFVILVAKSFKIRLTVNRLKGYSNGQLVFGHDISIPIKYMMD